MNLEEAVKALKNNNPNLKKLDLMGKRIGVEGCKSLSEVLKNNTTLQHLNLGSIFPIFFSFILIY